MALIRLQNQNDSNVFTRNHLWIFIHTSTFIANKKSAYGQHCGLTRVQQVSSVEHHKCSPHLDCAKATAKATTKRIPDRVSNLSRLNCKYDKPLAAPLTALSLASIREEAIKQLALNVFMIWHFKLYTRCRARVSHQIQVNSKKHTKARWSLNTF